MGDRICEAHPLLEWPHDNCPGPGMPEEYFRELGTEFRAIPEADCLAFRRLLYHARREPALAKFVRPLDDYVSDG